MRKTKFVYDFVNVVFSCGRLTRHTLLVYAQYEPVVVCTARARLRVITFSGVARYKHVSYSAVVDVCHQIAIGRSIFSGIHI